MDNVNTKPVGPAGVTGWTGPDTPLPPHPPLKHTPLTDEEHAAMREELRLREAAHVARRAAVVDAAPTTHEKLVLLLDYEFVDYSNANYSCSEGDYADDAEAFTQKLKELLVKDNVLRDAFRKVLLARWVAPSARMLDHDEEVEDVLVDAVLGLL